jgi:hypothetical protein
MSNNLTIPHGHDESARSPSQRLSPAQSFELEDSIVLDPKSTMDNTVTHQGTVQRKGAMAGVARHTIGLLLLLCVVFLWTGSSFLGSVSLQTTIQDE